MCGAATFLTQDNLQVLISDFRIADFRVSHDLSPSYNLRPMQSALISRIDKGQRTLETAQWWLLPHFEPEPKTKLTTFNARDDRLMQGMFRPYFQKHRALFLVDSYFEWKKEGSARVPFRFTVDAGKHFALAGLYSLWRSPNGSDERLTCSVVTTDANDLGKPIHSRMPVILDPSVHDEWLDPHCADARTLLPLLRPFPSDRMVKCQVSSAANSACHNLPDCIQPVAVWL